MNAYRTSAKIKLILIAAAVLIALSSLWYTDNLANRLMQQEREAVSLWVTAQEYLAGIQVFNPHQDTFDSLEDELVAQGLMTPAIDRALSWAHSMPSSDEIDFVFNEIVEPRRFSVPAIITDSAMTVVYTYRNVEIDSTLSDTEIQQDLLNQVRRFGSIHEPLVLELGPGLPPQLIHYGESDTVRALRIFPYAQLLFVALFVLVGYLSFSYVRRSEQSNLWVGMAKEAAHQLGTPLSSIMGWIELLRMEGTVSPEEAAAELEKDAARLTRVADRFQKIGSEPERTPQPLAPILDSVGDYIRRRLPQSGKQVTLTIQAPDDIRVNVNRELFEWVIENLLKNALDAMDGPTGAIEVTAGRTSGNLRRTKSTITIDVKDSGRGIERNAHKMIFRPGYSTRTRGWGLGLSLARRIVQDYHNGSLTLAASRPGEGSTFRIIIAEADPVA